MSGHVLRPATADPASYAVFADAPLPMSSSPASYRPGLKGDGLKSPYPFYDFSPVTDSGAPAALRRPRTHAAPRDLDINALLSPPPGGSKSTRLRLDTLGSAVSGFDSVEDLASHMHGGPLGMPTYESTIGMGIAEAGRRHRSRGRSSKGGRVRAGKGGRPGSSSGHGGGTIFSREISSIAMLDREMALTQEEAARIPPSILPPETLERVAKPLGGYSAMWPTSPAMVSSGAYDASAAGRRDIAVLERWLRFMLRQVELELDNADERADDVQRVYYMAFHELCRQVMVQSVPRGELMHRLWMDHTELYEVRMQGLENTLRAKSDAEEEHLAELADLRADLEDAQARQIEMEKKLKEALESSQSLPAPVSLPVPTARRPSQLQALREMRYETDARRLHGRHTIRRKSALHAQVFTGIRHHGRKASVFSQQTLGQLRNATNRMRKPKGGGKDDKPRGNALFGAMLQSLEEGEGKTPAVVVVDEEKEEEHRKALQDLEAAKVKIAMLSSELKRIDRVKELQSKIGDAMPLLMSKPSGEPPPPVETECRATQTDAEPSAPNRRRLVQFSEEGGDTEEDVSPKIGKRESRKRSKWARAIKKKAGGFSIGLIDRALKDPEVPERDLRWVKKNIHMIYMERISMGFTELVQPLGEFVFDFFLRKYGLPSVANRHLQVVMKNASLLSSEHDAVGMFFGFVTKREGCSLEHLNFVLEVILLCKKGVKKFNGIRPAHQNGIPRNSYHAPRGSIAVEQPKRPASRKAGQAAQRNQMRAAVDDISKKGHEKTTKNNVTFPENCEGDVNWVAVARAREVVKVLFPTIHSSQMDILLGKFEEWKTTGMVESWANNSRIKRHILDILKRTPRVERYRFVKVMLELKISTDQKLKDYFKHLFVEGDDNGDGVLEYSEFDAIVEKINPELGRDEVVAMFREAIMHPSNVGENEDAMCPEAFSSVCFDHGMQNFVELDEHGEYKLHEYIRFEEGYDDSPINDEDDEEEGWSEFDEDDDADNESATGSDSRPGTADSVGKARNATALLAQAAQSSGNE